MESKANTFDDFLILEKENMEMDQQRVNDRKQEEKDVQELLDGSGKKTGGNLFTKLWGKLRGKKGISAEELEIELEEIKPEAIIDDAEEKDDTANKKSTDNKIDAVSEALDKKGGEIKNDEAENGAVNESQGKKDEIEIVGNELEEIHNDFVADDNKTEAVVDEKKNDEQTGKNVKKKKKSGKKTGAGKGNKNAQKDIEIELENLEEGLGEDIEEKEEEKEEGEEKEKEEEEEEIEEQDEHVYDPRHHWGTTNLLHSFIYQKGEKYRFSEHSKIRNWFHKKIFGSYRSEEKARRKYKKKIEDQPKQEEMSGRFYGDDASYKRWEHNGVRNWFHDKWYHLKNAHRKSVDRFYNYEKDYRKMSWLNRVIWCVKNPLARIMVNFPRTHFGTEARQNLLGRMRKLYRQAISEGFIPASKLGDLDYDPFTGRDGQMGRATEAKQLEFNAEHKKDMLDGGRSLVRLKLLQIHSQKDVLVMRCMSEGVDPDAAVLEFMKNKTVQNSCVTCLNAIRQADWEIAKASAQKEGKPLPDEADNPANHPIEIGEGDEEALRLSGLINAQLGIPNEPLKKTKFWKETEKEVTEKQKVLDTDSYISLIRTANELPNAISTSATKGIAGSIFVGTDVLNLRRYYLKLKEAKAKGDMMECERMGLELAKSVNDIYNRTVTYYRFSRDMLGTAAGSGYAAPGAALSGILDASMGYREMKHFGKVVDDIEKLKKKEKDPGSRKSKILNMAGDTASADKSGGVGKMVTGFINTIGGALNTTGILGSFGLLFTAAGIISGAVTNSVVSSKKHEIGVRNVNTEMGLVERQRLLWDYFLKQGGQPSEYSRGITKRAILMEEGFTKGTRKQGAMQQQISYAQKIADNLNSGNPDPTYVKMMESLEIKKGEDNLYHMEVIANAIGSKHDNLIKNYIDSTTDNEFIDIAEKVKRRNAVLRDTLNKSMNKGKKRSEWIDTDKFIQVTADKMAEEKAEEKRKQKEAAKQAEEERKRRSEEHLRILREKRNKDKKENGGNAG